tara:strand:+ start:14 stop:268 length:255 start_codon:yes stop_codon:yes gene_type:complete
MVILPPHLVAVRIPGYYWHTKKHKLYSIKIGGELKEIFPRRGNQWVRFPHFRVSQKGRSRTLMLMDLVKLTDGDSLIKFAQVIK